MRSVAFFVNQSSRQLFFQAFAFGFPKITRKNAENCSCFSIQPSISWEYCRLSDQQVFWGVWGHAEKCCCSEYPHLVMWNSFREFSGAWATIDCELSFCAAPGSVSDGNENLLADLVGGTVFSTFLKSHKFMSSLRTTTIVQTAMSKFTLIIFLGRDDGSTSINAINALSR